MKPKIRSVTPNSVIRKEVCYFGLALGGVTANIGLVLIVWGSGVLV